MLGFNRTGRPDAKDYHLGRACISVNELDASTGIGDGCYRPLGNAPNLAVSVDIEELTHRASLCKAAGGAVVDRRLVISQTLNLSMTLEELSHENTAIFLQATTESVVNPAVAGFAAYTISTALAVDTCWYPLASGGVRLMSVDKSLLTVTDTAGPTVLTEGSDYEVDEAGGLIRFISGGANSLAGGETVTVAGAADATAPATIDKVNALADVQKRYAVKALVENANNADELVELEFHSVLLVADGELSLVGDELAQMGLTGVAEANSALAGSPTLTISKPSDS